MNPALKKFNIAPSSVVKETVLFVKCRTNTTETINHKNLDIFHGSLPIKSNNRNETGKWCKGRICSWSELSSGDFWLIAVWIEVIFVFKSHWESLLYGGLKIYFVVPFIIQSKIKRARMICLMPIFFRGFLLFNV